jgi:hypothetical protein
MSALAEEKNRTEDCAIWIVHFHAEVQEDFDGSCGAGPLCPEQVGQLVGLLVLCVRIIMWRTRRLKWRRMMKMRGPFGLLPARVVGAIYVTPQVLPWLEHTLVLRTVITCGSNLRRT